ncbi:MAG: hypothetical protein E7Z67_05145 [Thermoplasmata archaeon]|nr:hypothetical protein [Thermoplasmata archaeon]
MIYRSRFAPILISPLILVPFAPLLGWNLIGNVLAFTGLLLEAILLFVWLCIRYELTEDGLFILDGMSAENSFINYSVIQKVEKRDGLALELVAGTSYKRVAIYVDGKVRVQVSPKDRDGFIAEIESRIAGSGR